MRRPVASTLTIYSSLPLQGDSRPQSEDVVRGEQLALEKAGSKAGNFKIKYVSLDDSVAATGKWDPGKVSENARKAVGDDNAIAYLGEFNSGASAISIPLLNEAGILQVSPVEHLRRPDPRPRARRRASRRSTSRPAPRRSAGSCPPTTSRRRRRSSCMKDEGVKKLYILNDKEVYGKGIADQVEKIAEEQGIEVARQRRHRHQGRELPRPGVEDQELRRRRLLLRRHHPEQGRPGVQGRRTRPTRTSSCSARTAWPTPPFIEKVGSKVEKNTYITTPTLDPKEYPPAAQEFFKEFKAKYGKDPEPYAIYGYEAMAVMLDAIKRAGDKGNDRQAVVDEFFKTKGRDSVLGTYDIDENGDTTLSDYGGNRIEGGKLVFDKVIKAQTQ